MPAARADLLAGLQILQARGGFLEDQLRAGGNCVEIRNWGAKGVDDWLALDAAWQPSLTERCYQN